MSEKSRQREEKGAYLEIGHERAQHSHVSRAVVLLSLDMQPAEVPEFAGITLAVRFP